MIKVTIPQTIQGTIEVDVPEYFKQNSSYYKVGERVIYCLYDERFPNSTILTTYSIKAGLSDVELDKIKPITSIEFKEILCKAFARVAGFEVEELIPQN